MSDTAAVLTVSDRAFQGIYEDASGPALAAFLAARGFELVEARLVPDERDQIEAALRTFAEEDIALVVTTGGTGFSPRDVTPEATCAVCERLAPGIPEAMRAASRAITPHAVLSRAQAGICGRTLIVNVPGSPKAAIESLGAVIAALPHGLELLRAARAQGGQDHGCA